MPTQRPRHTITETDDLAQALARVRRVRARELQSTTELIGELILRGASSVVEDEEARVAARERLIEQLRALDTDPDAAAEVRTGGWARR